MKKYIDLTDQTFGNLRVLGRGFHDKSKTIEWECQCVCGEKKVIPSGSLRAGKVVSCGCKRSKGRRKDISGNRYGRLTVLSFVDMNANRTSNWLCRCDCGNELVVRKSNLPITGKNLEQKTFSCGCQKIEKQVKAITTHGELIGLNGHKPKEYRCWQAIISRCYNKNNIGYRSYGAKGVVVCDKWRHNFEAFLSDVGRAPDDKLYIDRIDPYGNYEPSNVRWVDFATSNANKRK